MRARVDMKALASKVNFTSDKDQSASPLLRLPVELKTSIYGYLAENTELSWTQRMGGQWGPFKEERNPSWRSGKPNPPGIVLACKEMHQEAIPILYARAKFTFRTMRSFESWLKVITKENLQLVQRMEVPTNQPVGTGTRLLRSELIQRDYEQKRFLRLKAKTDILEARQAKREAKTSAKEAKKARSLSKKDKASPSRPSSESPATY